MPEHQVNCIQDIAANHTYLINDQQLQLFTFCAGAQIVIVGGVASTTVTTATHVLKFRLASVAFNVILLGPSGSGVPAAGTCVIVTPLQASVATTRPVRLGAGAVQVAPAFTFWDGAQVVITGGVASVKAHVSVNVLPAAAPTLPTTRTR